MVGKSLLRQKTDIPMGMDPAPSGANLFLYTYENEYMPELISNDKIKACRFHASKHFIDDLDTLNGGAVFNGIYKDIYPTVLQLKVDDSGTHATFLNSDINAKDEVFNYKLFDKGDAFFFLSFACLTLIAASPSKFHSALVG